MRVSSHSLNDGHKIPQSGSGAWRIAESQAAEKAAFAIETDYHHSDTAKTCGNEAGVGEGMHRSALPRGDIFLPAKFALSDAERAAVTALDNSDGRMSRGPAAFVARKTHGSHKSRAEAAKPVLIL